MSYNSKLKNKKEFRDEDNGFLIMDKKIYDKIKDITATVLFHRLCWLWYKSNPDYDGYGLINLRKVGEYIDLSAATVRRKILLLEEHNLIQYKTKDRASSYIKIDLTNDEISDYFRRFGIRAKK